MPEVKSSNQSKYWNTGVLVPVHGINSPSCITQESPHLHEPPPPCLYPLLESNRNPGTHTLRLFHKSLRQRDLKHLLVDNRYNGGLGRIGSIYFIPPILSLICLLKFSMRSREE